MRLSVRLGASYPFSRHIESSAARAATRSGFLLRIAVSTIFTYSVSAHCFVAQLIDSGDTAVIL